MDRLHYYGMPHDLLWEVRSSGQFHLQLHETPEQACVAAATAAKQRYASTGAFTGLRMQASDHSWRQLDLPESGEWCERPVSV